MSQSDAVAAPAVPADPPKQAVGLIMTALLMVMALAMLDQTIVSTALPTIVGDLGGIEHLSWVVTAYLLTATVVTPIYGKLGDMFGRKIVLQVAIVLFIIGSALCGFAQDMTQLILFRAFQGIGGGGLMVIAMAAIADVVPARQRGKFQGMFGAVFGLATIAGPLLGGFFVDNFSWHWIFFINVPLALVAWGVIAVAFTAHPEQHKRKIDYAGAGLLGIALTAIVLFTSLGGNTLEWGSWQIISMIVVGIVATLAFLFVESRAAEPILPLTLFRNNVFSMTSAIGFIVGLALFGAVTFLPLYLQVVQGVSPTASGLQTLPMMLGLLVASIGSGVLISRIGRYKIFPVIGSALMVVALGLMTQLGVDTPQWNVILDMVILGLGLGLIMQVLILAAQNSVDPKDVGVATAGSTLFRQIGGSIGLSVFGALFATRLAEGFAANLPEGAIPDGAFSPTMLGELPPEIIPSVLASFVNALQVVFLVAAVIGVLAFILSLMLRETPLRTHVGAQKDDAEPSAVHI
ncbi:MAG: MFS transporter [Bauldia sp.]|nr:MFS transporter [Bauldia sp.]MCW5718948.1 MFS transporter [Bauldia sp.]